MKYFLTILFFVAAVTATAQDNSFVKYFDSTWKPCAKEKASFYTQFEKQDTVYKCTSYYLPSNKLYGRSTFADTLFKKGVGLMVRYYENGRKKDSTFFFDDATKNYAFKYTYYKSGNLEDSVFGKNEETITSSHFYENGNLCAHAFFDRDQQLFRCTVAYDSLGNIIPNFIFQKLASFKDGEQGWTEYLQKNLQTNIPIKKKAPTGEYTVILNFEVSPSGNIVNVSAENDPGYGTKEEAIRVLKKSPKWEPAILYGKNVPFHLRQSIVFEVK